ncbi:MAG: single-stranded-DNA-specific exonuclease RecJ [Coriobacteriales bacterium]|nr:single-stranded-DNA-specific exonuclease RecJ [Coriobacteriales bacterium]
MSGLLDNRRWDILPANGKAERMLCEELGVDALVARVLSSRGVSGVDEARAFLYPSLERDWRDPLEIPGMDEAATRMERALRDGEHIAVFGDFDVDGMTSTCLLTQALRRLGGVVSPYIPHRFGEGYGLSRAALDRVLGDSQPDLIITVDNGIAAAVEVEWLLEHGVDVVITDHHEPGDLVPQGVPVTNPKLSESCVSRELAGAGVALKLVCELGRRMGQADLWREYVDLAALGTVSDMMLLQGENRSLVAKGIELMQRSNRPGIVALAATAGIDLAQIQADGLPFSIIPRLNAAGRMGTTEVAFDLLISESLSEATVLAGMLEQTNTQRRETEAALSREALERIDATYDGERVIVCGGEGWHEGVKGIVASRIANRYHVPAIVFSISEGIARGSGRSVGSVDLFQAVNQCSDLLVRFGGHAGAVGVTCEVANLEAFRQRMQHIMGGLPEEQFVDRGEVAALVSLSELSQASIASLDALQPFGQGNKRPLLGIRGVFMRNRARVGYEGAHLRFVATDGAASVAAIMFRAPNMERAYACDGLVDLVVDAVNESWQGRTNPKLMVSDIVFRDVGGPAKKDAGQEAQVSATNGDQDGGGAARSRLATLAPHELDDALSRHMIGSHELLPAQKATLALLAQRKSALCVMATGRGKSLVFHLHAARCAIAHNQASIFVFPLRALVSDQAFHLEQSLGEVGVCVRVLTGETPGSEREEVYAGLASGDVDVVLTTPEYLAIHTSEFARARRVGFVVVDEAHHMSEAHGGRGAYASFPRILTTLGKPVVLAATATASAPVARRICQLLDIAQDHVVIDCTVRTNLRMCDHRDLRDRDMLLASLVATGQKTVVYVNSRDRAELICRNLRASIPELGHAIAFYHAGLDRDTRVCVEHAFRDGKLSCIVSTSAFGEGVNISDIRNVVLYHMPFCATEFNQMCGRAGRDGRRAFVHLLFGSRDARVNERILESAAPSRNSMVALYRTLVACSRTSMEGNVSLSDEALLESVRTSDNVQSMTVSSVSVAIDVFGELGFLEVRGYDDARMLHIRTSPERADLESSTRYAEGLRAKEEFAAFRDWALSSLPQEMLNRINRPITPGFGHVVDR